MFSSLQNVKFRLNYSYFIFFGRAFFSYCNVYKIFDIYTDWKMLIVCITVKINTSSALGMLSYLLLHCLHLFLSKILGQCLPDS